jgi:hypothetical protein
VGVGVGAGVIGWVQKRAARRGAAAHEGRAGGFARPRGAARCSRRLPPTNPRLPSPPPARPQDMAFPQPRAGGAGGAAVAPSEELLDFIAGLLRKDVTQRLDVAGAMR